MLLTADAADCLDQRVRRSRGGRLWAPRADVDRGSPGTGGGQPLYGSPARSSHGRDCSPRTRTAGYPWSRCSGASKPERRSRISAGPPRHSPLIGGRCSADPRSRRSAQNDRAGRLFAGRSFSDHGPLSRYISRRRASVGSSGRPHRPAAGGPSWSREGRQGHRLLPGQRFGRDGGPERRADPLDDAAVGGRLKGPLLQR
jgi:hypothetical protein